MRGSRGRRCETNKVEGRMEWIRTGLTGLAQSARYLIMSKF